MKRLILEISNDDYYAYPAEFVILDLDADDIGEIKAVAEKVGKDDMPETLISLSCRGANADYAAGFHHGRVAIKEHAGWMDMVHLHVIGEEFYLTGFYGYSDVTWRSETVPVAVLGEEGVYDKRK
jgi:hypothetical protein